MIQQTSENPLGTEGRLDNISRGPAPAFGEMASPETGNHGNARERLRGSLETAKTDFGELRRSAKDYSQAAARTADDFAHSRPWAAAGIGAGIGILIGMLIARS